MRQLLTRSPGTAGPSNLRLAPGSADFITSNTNISSASTDFVASDTNVVTYAANHINRGSEIVTSSPTATATTAIWGQRLLVCEHRPLEGYCLRWERY